MGSAYLTLDSGACDAAAYDGGQVQDLNVERGEGFGEDTDFVDEGRLGVHEDRGLSAEPAQPASSFEHAQFEGFGADDDVQPLCELLELRENLLRQHVCQFNRGASALSNFPPRSSPLGGKAWQHGGSF